MQQPRQVGYNESTEGLSFFSITEPRCEPQQDDVIAVSMVGAVIGPGLMPQRPSQIGHEAE